MREMMLMHSKCNDCLFRYNEKCPAEKFTLMNRKMMMKKGIIYCNFFQMDKKIVNFFYNKGWLEFFWKIVSTGFEMKVVLFKKYEKYIFPGEKLDLKKWRRIK